MWRNPKKASGLALLQKKKKKKERKPPKVKKNKKIKVSEEKIWTWTQNSMK